MNGWIYGKAVCASTKHRRPNNPRNLCTWLSAVPFVFSWSCRHRAFESSLYLYYSLVLPDGTKSRRQLQINNYRKTITGLHSYIRMRIGTTDGKLRGEVAQNHEWATPSSSLQPLEAHIPGGLKISGLAASCI